MCIFNVKDNGGGTIKRRSACALLLALSIAVFVFPSFGEIDNQSASDKNAKFGLNEYKNVKVNAAASLKVTKKSKKSKKSKYKKKTYKKVKAAYKYKKYKVKVRYKYKGKWRYKWVYRYYTPVYAQTTTTTTSVTKPAYTPVEGNPEITKEKVSADAKCSCSLYTDYDIHRGTWSNYCPYCGKYETLSYTNQQGCPEGMFYCDMCKGGCDADYCIVHGKVHVNTNPKYLTPA